MSVEDELNREIKKWTAKLRDTFSAVKAKDEHGERMISNIRAYSEDSKNFLERGDLIRSFECLIWAWALLEVGKELGHLEA